MCLITLEHKFVPHGHSWVARRRGKMENIFRQLPLEDTDSVFSCSQGKLSSDLSHLHTADRSLHENCLNVRLLPKLSHKVLREGVSKGFQPSDEQIWWRQVAFRWSSALVNWLVAPQKSTWECCVQCCYKRDSFIGPLFKIYSSTTT